MGLKKIFAIIVLGTATVRVGATNAYENLVVMRDDEIVARFDVEIAASAERRRVGLMWRESLGVQHGMLFDFGRQQYISMWMKNTLIPLDMLFITEDRDIAFIKLGAQPKSLKLINATNAVRYVLEVNAGEVDALGIEIGDELRWGEELHRWELSAP